MTVFRLILVSVAMMFVAGRATCAAQKTRGGAKGYMVEGRRPARMDMGVSVGAAYMFMSGGSGVSIAPRLGVRGALAMSLCRRDYALQMELGYLFNKIRAERDGAEYDVRSNVMEIPVMFSYRGLGPVRLNAGPVLSLAGTGRYDAGVERLEFGRLRTTLGYAAGAGLAVTRHVTFDVRYTGCFGKTDNWFEGTEFSGRSGWLSIGVGYVF